MSVITTEVLMSESGMSAGLVLCVQGHVIVRALCLLSPSAVDRGYVVEVEPQEKGPSVLCLYNIPQSAAGMGKGHVEHGLNLSASVYCQYW